MTATPLRRDRRWTIIPLLAAWMILGGLVFSPRPMMAQGTVPQTKGYEIKENGEPITSSTAQTPISSGTLRLLRTMETFHKDVKTIHAIFGQVRTDEIFLEQVASKGELWFDKPNRFRCDYSDPEPMINLIVGEALYMYVKKLDQVDYWTFSSPEERDQQLHQLLIGFGFKADDLVKHYDIHSSVDEAGPLAELKAEKLDPEKKVLFVIKPRPAYQETSPFKQLKVYIDKASELPEKIWYKDLSDASMTLLMKKIDLDVKLDPGLFDKDKLFKGAEYIDKRNTP
jgi:outer membrane lipoprotein-sorting protein